VIGRKKMSEEKKPEKTSIILTYNNVRGYPEGIHGDGRLVVVSSASRGHGDRAPAVLHDLMHRIYDREDFSNVDMIYVYAGKNAMSGALHAAANLVGESKVTLVACSCGHGEKKRFAESEGIDIIFGECRGDRTLGRIATEILNGER
jgi:hypothetical protein